jgi:Zn-dependent metalloprotease
MNKNLYKQNFNLAVNNTCIIPRVSQEALNSFAINLSKNFKQYISNTPKTSNWNTILDSKKSIMNRFETKKNNPMGLNIYRDNFRTPIFITGEFDMKKNENALMSNQPESIALSYISDNKDLFLINSPDSEFLLSEKIQDNEKNKHLIFKQQFKNIPVWGKEIIVHIDSKDQIYLINGRYIPTPASINPETSQIENNYATSIAENNLRQSIGKNSLTEAEKELLNWTGPLSSKCIWINDFNGEAHLAWHIQIRPNIKDNWYYFIDAIDGRILEKYNATQFDGPTTGTGVDLSGTNRTLNVYLEQGTYYMFDASRSMYKASESDFFKKGAIVTQDAKNQDLTNQTKTYVVSSPNNQWNDRVSVSAHYHLAQAYEYYFNTHNRNSLDDNGMTILSLIHVTDNNQSFDNAYWNGKFIVFGDGGSLCKEWAGAKDFAGHELTHAVITHTVDLEYKFQSGALNEALADWGGAMIDREDWKIGEDIARQSAFPTGTVRDMENPHNGGNNGDYYWQPQHMNEFLNFSLERDNGGVHYNSGIINKATSLIGNAIGKDKLEKIYYRLLQNRYLSKQSQFIDMRLAAVKSASELYGPTSNEVSEVKKAFDAVGILDGNETKPDPDKPPVQGNSFVAFVDNQLINGNTDNSLLIGKPVIQDPQNDIFLVTSTQVYTGSGCSVTIPDNGSFILFIDENNYVKAILPDGTNEIFISTTGDWHSISISADGKRLAATSTAKEPIIYIFDLTTSQVKPVELYIPTTTNDPDYREQPVYADALDWSLDGSVLVYDALNATYDNEGEIYAYWDINLLDPNSGVIVRLLPPLNEGVNAGNPVFANNGNRFIAFDVFDDNGKQHYINIADIFSGNLGNIVYFAANDFISGFPSFSVDDSKLAFHYFDPEDNIYYIFQIALSQNKLNPIGSPAGYVGGAIFPKWFAIGTRPTNIIEKIADNSEIWLSCYPNPVGESSVLECILPVNGYLSVKIFDYMGNQIATLKSNEFTSDGSHTYSFNSNKSKKLHSGSYYCLVEFNTGNGINNKKIFPIIVID